MSFQNELTADNFDIRDLEKEPKQSDPQPMSHEEFIRRMVNIEALKTQLAEDMARDHLAHWKENGAQALDGAKRESPVAYVRVQQNMLPKKIEVDMNSKVTHSVDDEDMETIKKLMGLGKVVEGERLG